MSREKDTECRAILVGESSAAICVVPNGVKNMKARHWIPRSQIGYLRKTKRDDGAHDVVFTLPEWLIEKKQCWELVP